MKFKYLTISLSFFTFTVYAGLIISLFYFFSPERFFTTITSERALFSIRLSILAATLATGLALILAIPTAYALSRFSFKGKQLVDILLEFPMFVSPAALGAMILIFFNNPLGIWIQDHVRQFVFTFYGVVLAQFITVLGVSVRLVKTALDEIPVRYEMVAQSLGATPFSAFRTVTLPLAKKGIIAACTLSWAKAIGEFGATMTVAGTMAMRTETLPIAVYMRMAIADIEGAVASMVILITISLGILAGVRLLILNRYVRT